MEAGAGPVRPSPAAQALRQVSEEGRRARQLDRAAELGEDIGRLVGVAQAALRAHAVLYFDIDRGREKAFLRAARGPASLVTDSVVPTSGDPFAFVLERGAPFYATDFKRLLHHLPWYREETRVGTLLALPVRTADVVAGLLVAERLEVQALTGDEPALLESFAELAADAIRRARASLSREELDAEFKAVYPISQRLSTLTRESEVRSLLLRSARNLVPLDGAAVVMADELQSRYVVEECYGRARRVLEARGGAHGEDLGGLGAPQRRGPLPARQPGVPRGPHADPRARRAGGARGVAARGAPQGPQPDAGRGSSSPGPAARSTRPPTACSASSPTRPRPRSRSSRTASARRSWRCATA